MITFPTDKERAWHVIKDMQISGQWTEQLVHEAIMKFSQWNDINEVQPIDGQRVLTWNNRFEEPRIQVYNEEYKCWDTEDGDDSEFDLDETTRNGELIIQYWKPLPQKP